MKIKKRVFILLIFLPILVLTKGHGLAANVKLQWDLSPEAAGYKIYMSSDLGMTWSEARDAGNVLTYTWANVPDVGLILFRSSAYDASGEAIRYEAGVWYNGDWILRPTTGLGIE
jgi:hypothetical protein